MHTVSTSCRERFRPQDFTFIEQVFTGGRGPSADLQSLFEDPDSLLAILDHDRLSQAVLEQPNPLAISPVLQLSNVSAPVVGFRVNRATASSLEPVT